MRIPEECSHSKPRPACVNLGVSRRITPMSLHHSELICVKRIPGKGRGVVARRPIKKGAVIERVPVLLVPLADLVDGLENRTLKTYFYIWDKKHVAVSLGYGSLYNHSYEPNARYIHGK